MESVRVGQGADLITHLLIKITGDLAHDRRRALRLPGTGRAVVLAGPVVDDVTLVDVAGTGQLCAAWTDIDVALRVENKVASTERAVGMRRLVPHRDVRCDAAIYQPFEQPDRAINSVACKPPRPNIEAAFDALDHGLRDGDPRDTVGTCALGVDDDPSLVVDEIVCVVSKKRIGALPCTPCRLWICQRNLLRRLAFAAPN